MKVERDFRASQLAPGVEYRWFATVEGKQYAYTYQRADDTPVSIDWVERQAQHSIMRVIHKDLFGERCL